MKNFEDFMSQINQDVLTKPYEKLDSDNQIDLPTVIAKLNQANIEITINLLRAYHEWNNQ